MQAAGSTDDARSGGKGGGKGIPQLKCWNCKETATDQCRYKLCGKCCRPVCAEGIHNVSWSCRGYQGKVRRRRTNTIWITARDFVSPYYDTMHHIMAAERLGLTREAALARCNDALKKMLDNPEMTIDDDEIDPIFSSTFPPGAVNEVLKNFASILAENSRKLNRQMMQVNAVQQPLALCRVPRTRITSGSPHGALLTDNLVSMW